MAVVVVKPSDWRASLPVDAYILIQRVEDGVEIFKAPGGMAAGIASFGVIDHWLEEHGFVMGSVLDIRGEGLVFFAWLTQPDDATGMLATLRWSGVDEVND